VLYLILIFSFSNSQLAVQSSYIFSITLIRAAGIPHLFRMSKRSWCCSVSKALIRSTNRA
jgi:hypothetical protein